MQCFKQKKIGLLYRIRHFVTKQILLMLYNAFILPHITYGLEVWGGTNKTFLNPILILQKRMSRVITFQNIRHHSAPLLYELKLLDVFKEYRYLIGIFIYDLLNNNLPHKVSYYFSHIDHTYETRNKEICNFKPKTVRTELGKRS